MLQRRASGSQRRNLGCVVRYTGPELVTSRLAGPDLARGIDSGRVTGKPQVEELRRFLTPDRLRHPDARNHLRCEPAPSGIKARLTHPKRVGSFVSLCRALCWPLQAVSGLVSSNCRLILTARHNLSLGMNAEGIFLAERIFGVTIVNSEGKQVPVRYIGEQHVREDLGRIPSGQDWLSQIKPARWMYGQRLAQGDSESILTKLNSQNTNP